MENLTYSLIADSVKKPSKHRLIYMIQLK